MNNSSSLIIHIALLNLNLVDVRIVEEKKEIDRA